MKLEPYLFFYGKCEEALNFYKSVLGGDVTRIMRNSEGPAEMEEHMPGMDPNGVMHANFSGNGISFMAADGNPATKVTQSNITLSLDAGNVAEGQRVFDALAVGGTVTMPFSDAFWGGKFGTLTDKYDIDWFVVADH